MGIRKIYVRRVRFSFRLATEKFGEPLFCGKSGPSAGLIVFDVWLIERIDAEKRPQKSDFAHFYLQEISQIIGRILAKLPLGKGNSFGTIS